MKMDPIITLVKEHGDAGSIWRDDIDRGIVVCDHGIAECWHVPKFYNRLWLMVWKGSVAHWIDPEAHEATFQWHQRRTDTITIDSGIGALRRTPCIPIYPGFASALRREIWRDKAPPAESAQAAITLALYSE